MLKTSVVYDVTISLNDGTEMNCLLLSKPTALTLAAIAEAKSSKSEVAEAMAFASDITVPEKDGLISEIKVAGTLVGTVSIVPLLAYVVTPKRGRKPKTAETATETAAETAAETDGVGREMTEAETEARAKADADAEAWAKADAAKVKADAAKAKADAAKKSKGKK